jgi:hypothetical protein
LAGQTVPASSGKSGSFGKELRIVTYGRSREPGGALSGEIKPRGLLKNTRALKSAPYLGASVIGTPQVIKNSLPLSV